MSLIFVLGLAAVMLGGVFLMAPKVAQEMNQSLDRVMNRKLGRIGEDVMRSRMWVGAVLVVAGILMMSQWVLHR